MRVRDAIRCLAGRETEAEAQLRAEHDRVCDRFGEVSSLAGQLGGLAETLREEARLETFED